MNKNNAQASQESSRNPAPSYQDVASSDNDAKRIQTPHPNDVLCGRGGGVNSHNKHFRQWVRERKDEYILATSKLDKAGVAREIVQIVQNQSPPGRFLMREATGDIPTSTYWIEINEDKAVRKCCQALREGAPGIRSKAKMTSNQNMEEEEDKHSVKKRQQEIQKNRKPKRMRLISNQNLVNNDPTPRSFTENNNEVSQKEECSVENEEKHNSPEDTIKLLKRIISLSH